LTASCSADAAGQTSHYHHLFGFAPSSSMMAMIAMGVEDPYISNTCRIQTRNHQIIGKLVSL
jgi:hypothetical protein